MRFSTTRRIGGEASSSPATISWARRANPPAAESGQVKRLKDLETENTRLRRAIADLTLDKLILQEAARGNF
jgi:cell division protein FtsB